MTHPPITLFYYRDADAFRKIGMISYLNDRLLAVIVVDDDRNLVVGN
jgi:hypothetical protein